MSAKHFGLAVLLLAILVLCASIYMRQNLLIIIGLALVPVGLILSQRAVVKPVDRDNSDAG